jgi:hypothetical protein
MIHALSGALRLAGLEDTRLDFSSPDLAPEEGIPYPYLYYRG